MKFRPCIDIHNGKVKQIVGGSLQDKGDFAAENFVSEQDAGFYARFYREDGCLGGHIILLNPVSSPYYESTKNQAFKALAAYPGGLQLGGGIHDGNAWEFLDAGASHVIVTSYVFKDGAINERNLEKMVSAVGKERLVLDLSCRFRDGQYFIVTDRWQKFTDVALTPELMDQLSGCCDEFLIHAVDVEGKASGVEKEVLRMLGEWKKRPVTYAGGVSSFKDLELVKDLGQNHVDVTIGSALDLFGGNMPYHQVLSYIQNEERS
ncbi:MAG: phosphoribosylformimino-5-aminoimidazole carboxamide ribotide isomerase [Clostridiales bacterium]|nr:phosphoribosylformimino-5-aminoimidazole carboxamide ribotide isomerase [Clostridiales bacterium]